MVIEPLLEASSDRKIAEKFPFSFCDYSIKQSILFNQPFRKESICFLHTHIYFLLNTDDMAPAHMLLGQIGFPETSRPFKNPLNDQRFIAAS